MKMEAAVFRAFGAPDVLKTETVERPEAGSNEVRVRVFAAGVQPADCAVRRGWTPPGAEVRLPAIPGNEFAGIVDQIGEGTTGYRIGDEVIGFRMLNSYAEYVTASADQLALKPAGMSWEIAGGLSASGQTAHTAIEELRVGPGDTLLVNGAAGAVGTIAVQLALGKGAKVIGTASAANHDGLRRLGVIPVQYGEGLAERVRALAPEGVDIAFDAAGEEGLRVAAELVKDRSRIGTIVTFDLARELGLLPIRSKRSAGRLTELAALVRDGKLRIHVRSVYPLQRAADAQREVETGHGHGKVVLRIAER